MPAIEVMKYFQSLEKMSGNCFHLPSEVSQNIAPAKTQKFIFLDFSEH